MGQRKIFLNYLQGTILHMNNNRTNTRVSSRSVITISLTIVPYTFCLTGKLLFRNQEDFSVVGFILNKKS
jgi:hypothetical protein